MLSPDTKGKTINQNQHVRVLGGGMGLRKDAAAQPARVSS